MYKMKRSGKDTYQMSWMGGWQKAVNDLVEKGMTKKEARRLLHKRRKNLEKSMKVS